MKKIIIVMLTALISLTSFPIYTFADDVFENEKNRITDYESDQNTDFTNEPIVYADASSDGRWIRESNGRWWYKHADGSYTKYNWEYINGDWYFFDEDGWMWTDWLEWKGNWYYLDPSSGKMHTKWSHIDGFWYYFNNSGAMNLNKFTSDYRTYEFYQSGNHKGALMITKINIIRQAQEKTNWCWAASAVMVGTYYTDSDRGQKSTVFHVKKSWINQGGTENEEIEAIDYASKGTKKCNSISGNNLEFRGLRDKIDANHPFLMRLRWNSGGGHAVVGAGYDQHLGKVWVIDPWGDTASQFYDYKGMIAGNYRFATGTGHFAAALVY